MGSGAPFLKLTDIDATGICLLFILGVYITISITFVKCKYRGNIRELKMQTREQKLEKVASVCGVSKENLESMTKETRHLPPALFGDSLERRYPLNNKQACLASMAEFVYDYMGSEEPAGIKAKIQKAASYYGLQWPQASIKDTSDHFSASDGDLTCNISVHPTKESLNKAASDLYNGRKNMSHGICRDVARYLVKYACKHDIDMDEDNSVMLMRLAGYGVADKPVVMAAITKRAYFNPVSDTAKRMAAYADQMQKTLPDVVGHEELDKIAEVLDAFDSCGAHKESYGTYWKCPEEELFAKTANEVIEDLQDWVRIPSVQADVSKSDLKKEASRVLDLLDVLGIVADESNMIDKVANLNKEQANFLFSEL